MESGKELPLFAAMLLGMMSVAESGVMFIERVLLGAIYCAQLFAHYLLRFFAPLPISPIHLRIARLNYLKLIIVWVVAFAVSMVFAFAW